MRRCLALALSLTAGAPQPGARLRSTSGRPRTSYGKYVTIWKMYFLSLAGNWLLKKYRGQHTPALGKLDYVDRVMKEVGDELPTVVEPTEDDLPVSAMSYTVEEHYRDSEDEIPIKDKRVFDGDLRNLFGSAAEAPNGQPAAEFITSHRREIVGRISYWTGESGYVVRQFIDFLREHAELLGLRVRGLEASTLIELTAFGTAVIMNYRHTNVIDGSEADEE